MKEDYENYKTKQLVIFITGVLIAITLISIASIVYNKLEWEHEQEMAKTGFVQEYRELGNTVWVKQSH